MILIREKGSRRSINQRQIFGRNATSARREILSPSLTFPLNYLPSSSDNRCWLVEVGRERREWETKLRNNDDKHPPLLGYANFILNFSFPTAFPSDAPKLSSFFRAWDNSPAKELQRSNYQLETSSAFSLQSLSVVFTAKECSFSGLVSAECRHTQK